MKPVILLVDDEEDLVGILQDAIGLSLPGYLAVASTSVDDAETLLSQLPRDTKLSLVCVDQRLGGKTGLDFLEDLRARYPHVPSVLFTGQASAREEARAKEVGATVLWKPLRLEHWLLEIQQLLAV